MAVITTYFLAGYLEIIEVFRANFEPAKLGFAVVLGLEALDELNPTEVILEIGGNLNAGIPHAPTSPQTYVFSSYCHAEL